MPNPLMIYATLELSYGTPDVTPELSYAKTELSYATPELSYATPERNYATP